MWKQLSPSLTSVTFSSGGSSTLLINEYAFNETGITNVAGSKISELADNDTMVTESASVSALNNQSTIPLPTVGVKANPQATVPITLNDIFAVANATEPVDLSVAEITTDKIGRAHA